MRRGNFHNAVKLLRDNMKNGILSLTEKTLQHVKQKHPPRHNADLKVLLPDKLEEVHPIKFTSIHAESGRKATLKKNKRKSMKLDAEGWKRLFTSTQFKDSTIDLCSTRLSFTSST